MEPARSSAAGVALIALDEAVQFADDVTLAQRRLEG